MTATANTRFREKLAGLSMRRSVLRSLSYARPYKLLMAGTGLMVVGGTVFTVVEPWPLQFLIDTVLGRHRAPAVVLSGPLQQFSGNKMALLVLASVAGFLVVLARHVLMVIDNYVSTKLNYLMVLDFRSDMFQHTQRVSLAYHERKRAGDFMMRINKSSYSIGFVPALVPGLAQSIITIGTMFWVAFLIDRSLALLAMAITPALYFLTQFYNRRILPQVYMANRMEGESMSIVHEAVSMIRVVLAFGREEYEYRRFRTQGRDAAEVRVRVTVKQTVYSLAVSGLTALGIALVTGVGGYHVLQGKLTIGQLVVILAYIRSMYTPLEMLSRTASGVQEQLIGLYRCFELLDVEPGVQDTPHAIEIGAVRGQITFERVSFQYDQRNLTLKDISFDVTPGQVVAIVGPTGAGKSTLVSLIPRFSDPLEGQVVLDGVDVRDIKVQSLRSHISIVLQEPILFSGSIADNIRYGKLTATMDEIIAAAQAANAHDFIEALPDGYDTTVGERGARLSGGEKQRISIARAVLKDAPILILDEPTSSIDPRTESVILGALDRLMNGRTTFLIAHRLSTIRNADVVLVLDHGELVQQGTHEELIEQEGLYQQLHEAQTARMKSRADVILARAGLVTGETPP